MYIYHLLIGIVFFFVFFIVLNKDEKSTDYNSWKLEMRIRRGVKGRRREKKKEARRVDASEF